MQLGRVVQTVTDGDKHPRCIEDMSRYFELLERAGKQGGFLDGTSSGVLANDNIPRPSDLGKQADGETVKLVQRVFVFPNSHAPKVVVFSSVEGDGSSEICSRAGEALAAQGTGSVCLVDANLRAPSLHHLLGVGKSPGLADALVRSGPIKDFAVQIAGGNLWLVPFGSPAAEAQSLLASDRLRPRLGELREEFDYVLMHAPPVSSYADAVLLGQMADGVVLVIEAHATRRDAARRAKEILEGANVRLLGAILNNRTFPIPEAIYRRL